MKIFVYGATNKSKAAFAVKIDDNIKSKWWLYEIIGNKNMAEVRGAYFGLSAITDQKQEVILLTDSVYLASLFKKHNSKWIKPTKTGPVELLRQTISNFSNLNVIVDVNNDIISILKKTVQDHIYALD